jgi:MFS family permease
MKKWRENIKYPRYFYVLLIVSFLTIWGYGSQRVLVPVQMEQMGTSVLMMGIFLSFFGLPRAVMNIVGGHLSDRFSKINNIIISTILFGVISTFFIGISESGLSIGLWRVVMAVGLSWATTAMMAYTADLTTSAVRGTAFGIQKMSTWLGMALAGLAAPILLQYWSIELLMGFMSFLSIAAVFLVWFFLKDIRVNEQIQTKKGNKSSTAQTRLSVPVTPVKKVVLVCNGFVVKIVEDGLVTFFLPVFILSTFNNVIAIGLVISIFTAVFVISQPLGGILSDYIGNWRTMLIGLFITTLSIVILCLRDSLFLLYIIVALAGVGSGIIVTSAESKASLTGPDKNKSRSLGYWRFYRDLGSTAGPILAGVCFSLGNGRLFLYFILLFTAVLTISTLWIVLDEKRWKVLNSSKEQENQV